MTSLEFFSLFYQYSSFFFTFFFSVPSTALGASSLLSPRHGRRSFLYWCPSGGTLNQIHLTCSSTQSAPRQPWEDGPGPQELSLCTLHCGPGKKGGALGVGALQKGREAFILMNPPTSADYLACSKASSLWYTLLFPDQLVLMSSPRFDCNAGIHANKVRFKITRIKTFQIVAYFNFQVHSHFPPLTGYICFNSNFDKYH